MITPDLIVDIFGYFSRFVSKAVVEKQALQPNPSKAAGYDELMANVNNRTDKATITELQRYIFSVNEKFLSDAIRNTKGYFLFVEYGQCTVEENLKGMRSADIELSITVAHEFSVANKDMVEEVLHMQKTFDILNRIVDTMEAEQAHPDYCGTIEYLTFPCRLIPIQPQAFYDCGGWVAIFSRNDELF